METTLVPPGRLGSLLLDARLQHGLTLDDLSVRSGGVYSMAMLRSIENGERRLDDAAVTGLTRLYGLEPGTLVPQRARLVIDLSEGRILMGDDDGTVLRPKRMKPEEVLPKYLAMVYSMRNLEPGTRIPLRVADLEVLGTALHVGPSRLESDLLALMADPKGLVRRRHRMLRGRVLIPAAGLIIAVGAAGALLMVNDSGAAADTPSARVGTAVVQERNADGSAGEVQSRSGGTVETRIGDAAVQERNADGSAGEVLVRAN